MASAITSVSAALYSVSYFRSIGFPTSTPDTAPNTPAVLKYSSARRYFSGGIYSSLDSIRRILPLQSSALGKRPYFLHSTGISAYRPPSKKSKSVSMHPPRILPEKRALPCKSSKPVSGCAGSGTPACSGEKSVRASYHVSLGVTARIVPVRMSSSKYRRVYGSISPPSSHTSERKDWP